MKPIMNLAGRIISTLALTLLLTNLFPSICRAQASSKVIRSKAKGESVEYFLGNRRISQERLEHILLSSNDRTVIALTNAERSYTIVQYIPGLIGGFCIGYGVYSKPTNTTLILSGIVSVVGYFWINGTMKSDLEEAIARYNVKVGSQSSYIPDPERRQLLRIGFTASF